MTAYFVLALLIATLADIFSTEYALRKGYTEGNPVAGFLMKHFGRWWYLPKMAVVGVVWFGKDAGPVWTQWAILALAVFMLVVAANNLRIARQ